MFHDKSLHLKLHCDFREIPYKDFCSIEPPISKTKHTTPLKHQYLAENIVDTLFKRKFHIHNSHYYCTEDGMGGLCLHEFDSNDNRSSKISRVALAENYNDGTGSASIYFGVRLLGVNAVCFDESDKILRYHSQEHIERLHLSIDSSIKEYHERFSIWADRVERYMSVSLTKEKANDIIADTILKQIVSGRNSLELLALYHMPAKGVAPRNAWSLFQCIVEILQIITLPKLIKRTTELVAMFDQLTKYKPKPSKYIQSTLL